RYGLGRGTLCEGRAAGAVLRRVRNRLEEREELRAGEKQRQHSCAESGEERADARPAGVRPEELPQKVDDACRRAMEERLRVTAAERKPQRRRGEADRGAARLAREPAESEEQKRKRRG